MVRLLVAVVAVVAIVVGAVVAKDDDEGVAIKDQVGADYQKKRLK